ncbi:MAG: Glu/Leu/Phe/Val dehydrogenase dimerization domain-containing protein, partial [Cyanobacteria bacterium J06642_2]
MDTIFRFADDLGPEKIVHLYDPATGLKAIVAIDNVALGTAIGGVRMAPDVTTEEVFRLARAMTLKNAAANLPHGGGKAAIVADPKLPLAEKERLVRAFARGIASLTDYIPGPDYEAGFSAFALHRQLVRYGIESIVVHVPSIEVAVNNRVKTDKRDASKLASLLEVGRLKGVQVSTEKEELNRMLTRTRQQLVEDRTAVKNRIRMKFHQLGLIDFDNNQSITHKLVQEHLERALSKELTVVVEAYWAIWKSLDEQIAKLDNELKFKEKSDPNESTYRSAPG